LTYSCAASISSSEPPTIAVVNHDIASTRIEASFDPSRENCSVSTSFHPLASPPIVTMS